MTCVIIDDNPIARATLAQLATMVNDLVISAECSNAIEAYNFLLEQKVDLLLLDIEMPEMSGLELIRNLQDKKPVVIFTTCKNDYAVQAFELNVADYLVKPVPPNRFIQAIDRARSMLQTREHGIQAMTDEFIFIRDSTTIRKLKLDDILFAEAMGDYVKIHMRQRHYLIHVKFKTAAERLPATNFIRVHRSFIVALDKIDCLQDGGLVIEGRFVPIADTYRRNFINRINVI
ncbi:LytTR family DNA-binding domain-containing protein [Chitinophaga filiformis]|uniref:LytR/AlgR family response regulator transcription factor n=1 Tax=Chitinophaga filiformis TaxID=104663 RepID=UPI001F1742B5|nr:LytTR family DNA-binding domain-containing protein [Chitinophaga filiformis]MCF6402855.1 LytTR family DNA-binding domain-containing protein [Chitinophaga filiformis]MCF6403227.1 LytTR family DNA-binding domain-containing protein [Chitinophaga filiformis]